jgi:uncharacterized protein YndB with AHSA1/START domain
MSDRVFTIKWVLGATLGVACVILLTAAIGTRLPGEYHIVRSACFQQSPEVLWSLLNEPENGPCWRTDLQRIERIAQSSGHTCWREVYRDGRTLTLEIVESTPPCRLVCRICDPDGYVSGRWSAEITPAGDGSRLTLTESGHIPNPFARIAFRLLVDPAGSLDNYLLMAGRRLGERPVVLR